MAVLEGKAYWSFVTTPNTKFTPAYSVNLVVDDDVANSFRNRGFTVKDTDDGPALIIKRKVDGPRGMIREAPKLYDKSKREINATVGNGSHVKVQFKEWETQWNGQDFKGLDFQAMQVLNLVEFSSPDGAEFDIEEEDEGDEI